MQGLLISVNIITVHADVVLIHLKKCMQKNPGATQEPWPQYFAIRVSFCSFFLQDYFGSISLNRILGQISQL